MNSVFNSLVWTCRGKSLFSNQMTRRCRYRLYSCVLWGNHTLVEGCAEKMGGIQGPLIAVVLSCRSDHLQGWGRAQVSGTFLGPPQGASACLSWRRSGQLFRDATQIACPQCVTHLLAGPLFQSCGKMGKNICKVLIFYLYFSKDIDKIESVPQKYKTPLTHCSHSLQDQFQMLLERKR